MKPKTVIYRMNGTVKRLEHERGYGFITGEDGIDRFFHRSAVVGPFEDLVEDDAVTFDVDADSGKGPRARNVERGDSTTAVSAADAPLDTA